MIHGPGPCKNSHLGEILTNLGQTRNVNIRVPTKYNGKMRGRRNERIPLRCRDFAKASLGRSCIECANDKLQTENNDSGRRNRYRDSGRPWECRVIQR